MSRTHELKCWPSFFAGIWDKSKTFEVRKNDRDFMVGDLLVLMEWNPAFHETGEGDGVHEGMTGRECRRVVTYVLRGGEFGIAPGHCVLGLALPDAERAKRTEADRNVKPDNVILPHDADVEEARREGRDAGMREARGRLRAMADENAKLRAVAEAAAALVDGMGGDDALDLRAGVKRALANWRTAP
jgi:hypothetical protein